MISTLLRRKVASVGDKYVHKKIRGSTYTVYLVKEATKTVVLHGDKWEEVTVSNADLRKHYRKVHK